MMVIDSRQIVSGEPIDLTRCYEASDRAIENKWRQQCLLAESALRTPDDSPWFALNVMPGRELSVEKTLLDHGVEALVPMRLGPPLRRRGRVIPATSIPAILGYVLVRCWKSNAAFAGIVSVDHVIGLVGGNEKPPVIAAKEVNKFNEKALAGHFDWERPSSLFRIGARVIVKDGPFVGFSGTIVSCRNDTKGDAVVEFQKFGRLIPMVLPIAILDPL